MACAEKHPDAEREAAETEPLGGSKTRVAWVAVGAEVMGAKKIQRKPNERVRDGINRGDHSWAAGLAGGDHHGGDDKRGEGELDETEIEAWPFRKAHGEERISESAFVVVGDGASSATEEPSERKRIGT